MKNPSPEITAKIASVLINPAWVVPASIVKRELAPALRRNPNYLAREHIRVFDGRGREIDLRRLRGLSAERAAMFTFRQDPGPKNSLGSIHLDMPNKDEVYMHDTPNKNLFERDYRFLSHGCVRVEGVYDLASWLLQEPGQPGQWDRAALRSKVDTGKTETIKLRRPTPFDVPIYLKARVVESAEDKAVVEAELIANEKVCATCRGTFVAVKEGHPAYHRW